MNDLLRVHPKIRHQGLDWLKDSSPHDDIVVSTRVRLARNIQGFPFAFNATRAERATILDRVRGVIGGVEMMGQVDLWEMAGLDLRERELLLERHLVSRELTMTPTGEVPNSSALALGNPSALGVMINEEDHLRLHTIRGGCQLLGAWHDLDQLDEELGVRLPYAFHHEFGFLTSCPTNVGTGLRASVLIHLPGLVLTKQIHRVLDGMGQLGLTYRGLYGEGSRIVGNLFQISNQTTLGKTEEDLIDHLEILVKRVIGYEKQARSVLLREAPNILEDKVWRAYGILCHAHSLSFEEMMNLLSGVRLGTSLKLMKSPSVELISGMMIQAQTAHLQSEAGRRLDEIDADVFRARYVRGVLRTIDESLEEKGPETGPTGSIAEAT